MVLLMALILVTAGCITDDDSEDDDDGPPPVGTTQGFTMPDFQFTDGEEVVRDMASWGGDFTIVHVIASEDDVFEPQFAQIRAVLQRVDNVSFEALTLSVDPGSTRDSLDTIADRVEAQWTFGLPVSDLTKKLSIVDPLTVFLLDSDHVIMVRVDDILGQGRVIESIEATWGVEPRTDAQPEVGSAAPDLVWRDIDGVEGSLSSLQGSPVLLHIWEMECPFCIELFVELEKVHANHSSRGLQVVSIDLITWETEEQVGGIRDSFNASWPFAIDGDNIQSRYDIWRLPYMVLIDGDGVVQWSWTGYTHSSVIAGEVEKLI
jgi:thiol-disulfide isomerase/thioredoxin